MTAIARQPHKPVSRHTDMHPPKVAWLVALGALLTGLLLVGGASDWWADAIYVVGLLSVMQGLARIASLRRSMGLEGSWSSPIATLGTRCLAVALSYHYVSASDTEILMVYMLASQSMFLAAADLISPLSGRRSSSTWMHRWLSRWVSPDRATQLAADGQTVPVSEKTQDSLDSVTLMLSVLILGWVGQGDILNDPLGTVTIAFQVGAVALFLVSIFFGQPWERLPRLGVALIEALHLIPLGIDVTYGQIDTHMVSRFVAPLEIFVWAWLIAAHLRTTRLGVRPAPVGGWPRASLLPRLTAVAALVGLALLPSALPVVLPLLLGLALVGREALLSWRRWKSWSALDWTLRHEQTTRQALQARLDGLARLIHDLAGPIQGLWHTCFGLEKAGALVISERLEGQIMPLDSLSRQMLADLQGQAVELRQEYVDLCLIIEDAIDAATLRALLQNVDITRSFAVESTRVLSDRTAVRRILDNLLTNALDVLPQGGRILVELARDSSRDDVVVLCVRDSGPGLTVEQQAIIFKPGVRLREGPGLGLGLANVSDLVGALGGSYEIRSVPGSGTNIRVRLPKIMHEGRVASDTRSDRR